MYIVDNKAHLVSQIKREAEKEAKTLESEFNDSIKEYQEQSDKEVALRLKEIESKTVQDLKNLEKQRTNNFALEQEHKLLEKQRVVRENVMSAVLESSAASKKIISKMVEALEKGSKQKIVHFQVPKTVKLTGAKYKPVLNEFKVIGVVSKNEELEYTVENFLQQYSGKINTLIEKEF